MLEADYTCPDTGELLPPISARLEILHKFDSIHIRMESDKSHSSSYVSGIIEDEGMHKYLCYLYGNDADNERDINPKHDGATRLRIKHDGNSSESLIASLIIRIALLHLDSSVSLAGLDQL